MSKSTTPAAAAAAAPEKPRRMTLSQIVELLLSRSSGERSTVTLKRNAKGEIDIEVKVRTGDDGEVVTVEDAERKAIAVYDRLSTLYPPTSGHENAAIELTRNAKGETQISVDVKTGESGQSVTTLQQALDTVTDAYKTARARFPLASGQVGATGEETR